MGVHACQCRSNPGRLPKRVLKQQKGSTGRARRALGLTGRLAGLPEHLGALRAALPKLWKRKSRDSELESGDECTVLSLSLVRAWLKSAAAGKELNAWAARASDLVLGRAFRQLGRCPPLRLRMGFRFQDPSQHGGWEVSNLKGYRETQLGRLPLRAASIVSWHSYWAAFRVRLRKEESEDKVIIDRQLLTKDLSTAVEKHRRGEARQLASGCFHVTAHSRRQQAADKRKRIKVVRKQADLLPAVVMKPLAPPTLPRYTLIFLHGMGEVAMRYADRPHYFHDGSAAIKVIIPTAPLREISCFDTWWSKVKSRDVKGSRWRLEKFNSWYDYISNRGGRKEDAIDIDSLHRMQQSLHEIIAREAEELGGRSDRIILGGKSQGSVTALDAVLTYPKRLGGFIGLVGHVLSCTPIEEDGPQLKTPLHFYHEVEDDIMQWHWVSKMERRLRKSNYNVRSFRGKDPEGNGHFVGGVEGAWIRKSLRMICEKRTG
ncbi:unnamed protein product [Symbiodinium pilosum]|uniref:Phospholipase/carboxylesterase/thioesterase domain-containing protein n=1 Tax=Symbiodinium pilosum TaxID=2952 RepID=A0A812XM76_SYMPI|nr:unnamed protein product [Symbiodinium pilosum]